MKHQNQQPHPAQASSKAMLEDQDKTAQGQMTEPDEGVVTASLVAEDDRLEFLPKHFGIRRMLQGEALVFGWMDALSKTYGGGYWNFYTLSNGGFYMAPDRKDAMRIDVVGNDFSGDVSADAAGVIATLFALRQMAHDLRGTEDGNTAGESYRRLLDFVGAHPEAGAIYRAID